jgi:hypothetical protein
MVVASTTAVSNLNADLVDGLHSTSFIPRVISATAAPTVNDDIDTYLEGTVWIEQDADKAYILVDNANGAAAWTEIGGGGASAFTDLTDVPANYAGAGGYVVKVKADASGLEFVAGGAGVASFVDLDDVPASYVGQEGLYLRVNATADGLEYAAGGSGAPAAAKYIVQEAHGDLSAEQSLGALTTGLLLNTVTAGVGVLSKAVAADLPAHDILSAQHGDTLADTLIRGDVFYVNATPKMARLAKGTATQVLGGDGTDTAWVTACPRAAQYIVGAAHADLSAERVKPQLYLNYDIDDTPAAPNALDDEFDNSSLDVKWTIVNDPAGANAVSETAYVGYLWVGLPELVTDTFDTLVRVYQTPPGDNSAWTIIIKASVGIEGLASSTDAGEFAGVGVYLGTAADDELVATIMQYNDAAGDQFACRLQGQNDMGVPTFNNYQIVPAGGTYYLKLKKSSAEAYTSSNVYNMYYSFNGILWYHCGQQTKTFAHACDEIGIIFRGPKAQGGTPVGSGIVDFFRRTV